MRKLSALAILAATGGISSCPNRALSISGFRQDILIDPSYINDSEHWKGRGKRKKRKIN